MCRQWFGHFRCLKLYHISGTEKPRSPPEEEVYHLHKLLSLEVHRASRQGTWPDPGSLLIVMLHILQELRVDAVRFPFPEGAILIYLPLNALIESTIYLSIRASREQPWEESQEEGRKDYQNPFLLLLSGICDPASLCVPYSWIAGLFPVFTVVRSAHDLLICSVISNAS